MKCAIEIGSDGMVYVPSSMIIISGIYATLQLLLQQFERL
jgi:hypothetical protein